MDTHLHWTRKGFVAAMCVLAWLTQDAAYATGKVFKFQVGPDPLAHVVGG